MTSRTREVSKLVAVLVAGAVVGAAALQVASEVRHGMWELGGGTFTDDEIEEARQMLAGRAPFEEVEGTATAVLDEMLAALDAELGATAWDVAPSTVSTNGCTEVEWAAEDAFGSERPIVSEGASASAPVALDRRQTAAAVAVVADQARLHGFADQDAEAQVRGSGNVSLRSLRGGSVTVSVDEEELTVSVTTDCFLTESGLAALG